jgi:hypothetical protein
MHKISEPLAEHGPRHADHDTLTVYKLGAVSDQVPVNQDTSRGRSQSLRS